MTADPEACWATALDPASGVDALSAAQLADVGRWEAAGYPRPLVEGYLGALRQALQVWPGLGGVGGVGGWGDGTWTWHLDRKGWVGGCEDQPGYIPLDHIAIASAG